MSGAMFMLEIESQTSDLKASQPLATSRNARYRIFNSIDKLPEPCFSTAQQASTTIVASALTDWAKQTDINEN